MKIKLQTMLKHNWRTLLLLCTLMTTSQGGWADYYVAGNGSGNWCDGKSWDAEGSKMSGSGTAVSPATITFSSVSGNDLQFKVTNGSWSTSYGYSVFDSSNSTLSGICPSDNGGNIKLKTGDCTADITITYNGTNITVDVDITSYSYYYVDDSSWSSTPSFTALTAGSTGTYCYIQKSGTHEFKITTDNAWTECDYGKNHVSAGYNSTDVTDIGDGSSGTNAKYWWGDSHNYYILVYYPHTADNDSDDPIICASSTLPCTRPTITASSGGIRCGDGTVSLTATASAGSVKWYNVSTGGTSLYTGSPYTPSITATTNYWVEADNSGCVSASRTQVTATKVAIPVLSSPSSNERCGTGDVTFSISTSAGTVNWYDASTAGTLHEGSKTSFIESISASTTYYAEGVNTVSSTTCKSASRTAVTSTVNAVPSITAGPTATPSTICLGATSTLSATGSAGSTIYFYDSEEGTTPLASLTVTPAAAGTATYYAAAETSKCKSARSSVGITVNSLPTITLDGDGPKSGMATYPWEWFTVTAETSESSVDWSKEFVSYTGASSEPDNSVETTATTYKLKSAITANDGDKYTITGTVTDDNGCVNSYEYDFYINAADAETCN